MNIFLVLKRGYAKAALHFPDEVTVEAPKMIHRLIEYLQKKFEHFKYLPSNTIIGCEISKQEVKLTNIQSENFFAPKAVICNGRDFQHLFTDLFQNSGIKVVKLNMMETMPYNNLQLKGNILTGLTIRRYEAFHACPSFEKKDNSIYKQELFDWGIHLLFKHTPEGSLIIGDSHEYADVKDRQNLGFGINQYINELIIEEGKRILELPHWKMNRYWAGYYTQHNEKEIFRHNIEDKIFVITAIGGKGMSTSLGYAKSSVESIFD